MALKKGNFELLNLVFPGWVSGLEDKKEKTDTHYRCMDGNGLFNWRLCYPFHYMPEEKVMVVEKKVRHCHVVLGAKS